MVIGSKIYELRTKSKLSQEQFGNLFDVSRQMVQKWESGAAIPELNKIVKISKHFGVSLDKLVLDNDSRMIEEMEQSSKISPTYSHMDDTILYDSFATEYQQSVEEGLDIESYQELFEAARKLPKSEIKSRIGDILFDVVINAPQKEGYQYTEPSDLATIKTLRKEYTYTKYDTASLEDKIHGAWMGRICGCMLGKTIEGIRTDELWPLLKETDNYPMHRYIYRTDLNDDILNKYKFNFAYRKFADEIDGMPADDDTNYMIMSQLIIENYGKDFTPYNVSRAWLTYQSIGAYFTAERVAYYNFIKGYEPPISAIHKNPYREWIGAQIRGDYYGYINPGNPEKAAEMAWRDASISHIKNGIYGEMFIAAMIAIAATTNNIEDIIKGGLAQIPYTSRLYESILSILEFYKDGKSQKECFDKIRSEWNEYTAHGWCHTIANAMIVVASLLYGESDYGKSICMAVENGYDTDCNGATVGSILGMANGYGSIPEYWTKPMNDTLHTQIFGVGTVKISDRVKMTLKHIEK